MIEYDKLRAAIRKRANTNDEWDNAVHLCWEEMVTVFSEDMSKTICFLKNDCIVIHLPCSEQYSKASDNLGNLVPKHCFTWVESYLGEDSRFCSLRVFSPKYTEVYRSGHNGPDSKSGDGHPPSVGSNPTASVRCAIRLLPYGFFMSSPIPDSPARAAWQLL